MLIVSIESRMFSGELSFLWFIRTGVIFAFESTTLQSNVTWFEMAINKQAELA